MKLPAILHTISEALTAQNAKAIIVGGSVRDHFLHLPVKDYDIEVYGLDTLETLQHLLNPYGPVNLVGRSFGILKLTYEGGEYDFSFPRKESKIGRGHGGFEVEVDGFMEFKEAARRRDFSCNAMGYVIGTGEMLDPFGGRENITQGILRHIESGTFIEDPLRVYRAVQFTARFGWTIADETMQLCKQMVSSGMLDELPKERIYAEWQKLLLKAPKPSIGFELMREMGIIARYFPELHALINTPQSPKWHPEGDVWIHTMMALDEMAKELSMQRSAFSVQERLKFLFAILCHDLGKPVTTTIEADGRIRSIGHEKAGVEPTKSLLYRLTDAHDFIASLLPFVEHHLKPSQYYSSGAKDKTIRKLATKINIEELVLLAKADFLGRSAEASHSGTYPAGEWLLKQAEILDVKNNPLIPLIQGRDLIKLGLTPSPAFKKILDEMYDRQLNGTFSNKEEAETELRSFIAQKRMQPL